MMDARKKAGHSEDRMYMEDVMFEELIEFECPITLRREVYLDATQALEDGVVDEVV